VTAAATTPATTPVAPATTATAVATTARQTTPPPATTAAATTSASPGFVPARTFLWPAARQATGYRVAFVHDGAVVFQHVTKVARVELPASFRFEAGRYSWSVWALPQARNARPLAASEFVLTPAGAAAANRP
jgi:hypothetical protein